MHNGTGGDRAAPHGGGADTGAADAGVADTGAAAPPVPSAGERALRASAADGTLSARAAAILEFEAVRPGLGQAGDQEIRDRFAMSGTRYFQLLNQLLDEPAALAHDPVLVGRLRRLRETRRRARSAARLPD